MTENDRVKTIEQKREAWRESSKKYREKNRTIIIQKSSVRRAKLKLEVFSHYSKGKPKCAECTETNLDLLVLDHIHNDGKEHRKKNNYSLGTQTWIWARKNGYPPIFQVLCYRHNNIKNMQLLKKRLQRIRDIIVSKIEPCDHQIEKPHFFRMLLESQEVTELEQLTNLNLQKESHREEQKR